MRTTIAVLALVIVGCASGAVAKPSLRLTSHTPLVVQGERFRAGERVVLTAMTGYGGRRVTVVAPGGRFRVSFGSPKGCGAAYAFRAVGNKGSKASLVLGEAPVCAPPPRD